MCKICEYIALLHAVSIDVNVLLFVRRADSGQPSCYDDHDVAICCLGF